MVFHVDGVAAAPSGFVGHHTSRTNHTHTHLPPIPLMHALAVDDYPVRK